MKTSQENLCRIINDLYGICKNVNSLRKEMEIDREQMRVDDYFTFLLASERIRETIEILGRVITRREIVVQ